MFRQIIKRSVQGAMIGIFILQVILIIESFKVGDGTYYAFSPDLLEKGFTEAQANLYQFIVCCLMGAIIGSITIVFEIERLSLLIQTMIHFVVLCSSLLGASFLCCWIPLTPSGIKSYCIIMVMIYAVIWAINYLISRVNIKKINEALENRRK